jgi:hypothetical protein
VSYASTDNQIAVEITPPSVQLAPNEVVNGLVVVHNVSPSMTLNNFRLSTVSAPKGLIQISSSSVNCLVLLPGDECSWDFTLVRPAKESITRKIYFRLNYQQKNLNGQVSTRDVVYPLEIQDYPFLPLGKIATARVETTLSLLQEGSKNSFYLIVTNLFNAPIQVTNVHHQQPEFLKITPDDFSTPVELAPQESKVFIYQAIAENSVQPGQEIVVFDVAVSWEERSHRWNGTIIAIHKFGASVVGVSEILKLIGVPIFFLIPGALILLVFQNLWNRSVLEEYEKIKNLDMAKPTFWIIAIPLSLALTLFYPTLSSWLGSSRDLLAAYGLRDILNVWLFSVLLGFLAWVVGAYWHSECIRRRDEQLSLITPIEGEGVESLLQKLIRRDTKLQLPSVSLSNGDETLQYFLVATDSKDSKQVWVIPPIRYRWTKDTTDNFIDEFMEKLGKPTINEVAALVQADGGNRVKLEWLYDTGPVKLSVDQINKTQEERDFIEQAQ